MTEASATADAPEPAPAAAPPTASPPSSAGASNPLREFFLLQGAERAARALPEGPREAARRELAIAFQKRDAAETLWPRGSTAEAMKLARASIDAAASALDAFASAVDPLPAWLADARAIGAGARDKAAGTSIPELEADAKPEHEDAFRALVDAGHALERAVGMRVASAADLARVRRSRAARAIATGVFVALVLAWALHKPAITTAIASTQVGEYGGANVIDGDTKTFWVLDRPGYVDLTLSGPRSIRAVRMIGYNPPFNDRFTKDVHLTAFSKDGTVRQTDFTLPQPPPGSDPFWVTVPLEASGVDRIRIEVRSWTRMSGCIAEVQIE
jgi:hypothetical protein